MRCRLICALLFLAWTTERLADEMYWGGWRSIFSLPNPLFESLPGVHLMTWQVLILALGPLCLLATPLRRRAWPMEAAILTSLSALLVTLGWGVARGGSAYQCYFQLRWFTTGLFVALLLLGVVRKPADLKALARTIVAAALVRSTLATYFYLFHVRGKDLYPRPEYMTSHDDSLLFTAAILVVLAWALARHSWRSWAWFALVFVWIAAGIKANNRRLAWIELIAMMCFAYLMLPRRSLMRRRLTLLAVAAAPLLVVYVSLGIGRSGWYFAPVRAVFTTAGSAAEQDLSTIARNEEDLNLVWTYQKSPLLGQGWGHPYQEASSRFTRGFGPSFYQYGFLPHNSLLALATFAGLAGLFGVWLVIPVTAFIGALGYRYARTSLERAAAMFAVCFLPAYAIQAFGDIGFESFTGGLLLAVAAAAAGKVAAWSGAWPTARARAAQDVASPAAPARRAA